MARPGEFNFNAICVYCEYYKAKDTFHRCTKGVDIVTGKPYTVDCFTARSQLGNCGPKGLHFVPKEGIVK